MKRVGEVRGELAAVDDFFDLVVQVPLLRAVTLIRLEADSAMPAELTGNHRPAHVFSV
jgi:hypothetical protein